MNSLWNGFPCQPNCWKYWQSLHYSDLLVRIISLPNTVDSTYTNKTPEEYPHGYVILNGLFLVIHKTFGVQGLGNNDLHVLRTGESILQARSSWTALGAAPSAPTSPAPGCQSHPVECRTSPQTLWNTQPLYSRTPLFLEDKPYKCINKQQEIIVLDRCGTPQGKSDCLC